MPLYEYQCQNCHRHVEKIQSFSAPPLEVCPHCGGKLERTISAPAVQFKGSGWYVSDYGKGGKKPETSGKPGSADISAGADSKTETASASAPAPESPPKSESAPSTSGGASTTTSGSNS